MEHTPLPRLEAPAHVELDLSDRRRVLLCADIHGSVGALLEALERAAFDPGAGDVLVIDGDLIDRGPDSEAVVRLLDEPHVHAVRGNHEDMLVAGFDGDEYAVLLSVRNGGMWFALRTFAEQRAIVRRLRGLPYALTIRTPGGRRIGVVHAEPGDDWDAFTRALAAGDETIRRRATWGRDRLRIAKAFGNLTPVAGIDAVYCGHVAMDEPFADANVRWIDTRAYKSGTVTIVDADADGLAPAGPVPDPTMENA